MVESRTTVAESLLVMLCSRLNLERAEPTTPAPATGFFVRKFLNGKGGKLYDYVRAQAIPEVDRGGP